MSGIKRDAFTMMEVIFVIVILGILAAVAIPKFAMTRQDAIIADGRATVSAVRSGIITERQTRLLQGDNNYTANLDNGGLFGAVLTYSIAGGGEWAGASPTYTFTVGGKSTTFTYYPTVSGSNKAGTFNCVPAANNYCNRLAN